MEKELIKDFPVSKLIPYERNPRINKNAVDAVIRSIKRTGNIDPIEINENNIILCGHTRVKALQKLGINKTDVLCVSGLTEQQQIEYRILNNKTAEIAEWDFEILEADFTSAELLELGFDGKEFQNLNDIQVNNENNYYLSFLVNEEQRQVIENRLSIIDGETNTEKLLNLCSI
jgi:hypothetical protein